MDDPTTKVSKDAPTADPGGGNAGPPPQGRRDRGGVSPVVLKLDRRASEPYYVQVRTGILALIRSGALTPDRPIPPERKLAEELGLSRLTIRRAILDLAKQGLLRRIPGRGTFLAEIRPERSLSGSVSVVLAGEEIPYDVGGPFFMHLVNGLYTAITPGMVTIRGGIPPAGQVDDARGLLALWVLDEHKMRALAALGIPLVGYECAADPTRPRYDNISHANESGAYAATSALIQLGHRDLGCVVHPTSVANERRAGFERALRQHGLPLREERVYTSLSTSEAGYAFGRNLFRQPARAPTALLCTDDTIACGIISAAHDAGLSVPGFISIIGFGDLGIFTAPSLSSVRVEIAASAREAIRLFRDRERAPRLPPRSVILPTEYIRRGSCGPPRVV